MLPSGSWRACALLSAASSSPHQVLRALNAWDGSKAVGRVPAIEQGHPLQHERMQSLQSVAGREMSSKCKEHFGFLCHGMKSLKGVRHAGVQEG